MRYMETPYKKVRLLARYFGFMFHPLAQRVRHFRRIEMGTLLVWVFTL